MRMWLVHAMLFFGVPMILVLSRASTSLPRPVPDTASTLSQFSEERARRHVATLVDGFGVRMVGMPTNEVKAPEYIESQVRRIASRADPRKVKIEIDVQTDSGSFSMDFLGGLTMVYHDVKNVLVRVSSAAGEAGAAGAQGAAGGVLINSHYDSALSSPGAMDAAASVGVMLEVLRVLALEREPPRDGSPYIFVFNGGEEALMTGAHAFTEHHPWARQCRYIVNMDSCGGGGREIVFQAGPGHAWLMDLYARVAPHPFGSVVAQDIFALEVIPSDTDYRVYRDELGVRGYDLAYFSNGYVYHTQIDDMRAVGTGSLQHEGDNVVALAAALADQPDGDAHPAFPRGDPSDPASMERAVFYDFLGYFMVSYRAGAAAVAHVALAVAVAASWIVDAARHRSERGARAAAIAAAAPAALAAACHALSWVAAAVAGAALGAAMNWLSPMSWFAAGPGAAAALFSPLAAAACVHVQSACLRERALAGGHSIPQIALHAQWGAVLLWLSLALAGTAAGLGAAYVPFHWSLWGFGALAVARAASLAPHMVVLHPWRFWALLAAATAVPAILTVDVAVNLVQLFVPLTGRLGGGGADVIVGVLVSLFTAMLVTGSSGALLRAGNMRRLRNSLAVASACVAAVLASGVATGGSYSATAPKRIFTEHMIDRTGPGAPVSLHVVSSMDSVGVGPLLPFIGGGSDGSPVPKTVDRLYMDFLFPIATILGRDQMVAVPAPPPPIEGSRVSASWCARPQRDPATGAAADPVAWSLNITVTPPVGAAYATGKIHGDVRAWSITETLPPRHEPHPLWEPEIERPFLHFRRSGNGDGDPWWFTVDVASVDTEVKLILATTEQKGSDVLHRFAKDLPDWTTVAKWVSDRASYTWRPGPEMGMCAE